MKLSEITNYSKVKKWKLLAGSRRETFHSWQRWWRRRLGICKGGIEPRECPRIFLSIYPPQKPDSAYFIALCSHLWLYLGLSPTTISLSLSKCELTAPINKVPWQLGVFKSNPSDGSLTRLTSLPGHLQLTIRLFTVSQPWEAREA